ncbi:MAG TPA: tetratricopeptide repeat protein [Anaerolineales bacterium]|nr:tetratricopeptide repeat protein [Anaerolineales bacterium]
MKTYSPLGFYLRIVCVSLLVAVLNLSAVEHTAKELLLKANQAMQAGDSRSAAENLANVAIYFPWRYELNTLAARLAFQTNDPKATIRYLERPGTISHLSNEDLLLLGDAYAKNGNSEMAEAIWKRASELNAAISATERLADLYLKQKNYSTAASYLQQLVILDPSRSQLYYQIGVLYAVSDPTKALPFLVQAAEMDQPDASRAKTLHDKIRTASLFEDPAYTVLIVGRQLADWGDWRLAWAAFSQAVTLRSDYADAWAFYSEAKQQVTIQETGAVSSLGLPELELAIQLDSKSILANTLMGIYWERQGNFTQAENYLTYAISVSPQDPYLYSELGNIYSKAGDLPIAQAAYEKSIELTPRDPLFYCQLAQFAMDNQIQIRELALPAARKALLLDPQDANSLDVMAQVMLMLLDYQSAERFSMAAVKSNPTFAQAYLHLGTAYLYQGKSELAQQWLSKAETVDPKSWVSAQATRLLEYYFPK